MRKKVDLGWIWADLSKGKPNVAGSELRSAILSPDLGNFQPSLSFCRAGWVARVFKDETCHSTHQSWFLRVETCQTQSSQVGSSRVGRFC